MSQSFEASLMDWADEIAYAVHDLEDGVRAGLIPIRVLRLDGEARKEVANRAVELQKENPLFDEWDAAQQADVLEDFLQRDVFDWSEAAEHGTLEHKVAVKDMSTRLIDYFITSVDRAKDFDESSVAGIPSDVRLENRLLNAIVFHYVIDPPSLASLQHGQRRVIRKLWHAYLSDTRLLPKLEARVVEASKATGEERGGRRIVCDYVAGMTDTYAHKMFDRIFGGGKGSVGDLL
jgi:dGTPase